MYVTEVCNCSTEAVSRNDGHVACEGAWAYETDNQDANDQSAGAQGPRRPCVEEQGACAEAQPAKARCVHARLHDDAEKTQLRAAEGREGPFDQRLRSHQLHRRRRSQPAGTLGRTDTRRTGEGPSRRALSHGPRLAGYGGRQGPQAEPLEIWGQEAQGRVMFADFFATNAPALPGIRR